VKHYKQTIVRQRAREAIREVCRLMPRLPREEIYGMGAQLTRANVSVVTNIAEGRTRETNRDKAHFLAIAQGSPVSRLRIAD
jgi:four helix bundle protein